MWDCLKVQQDELEQQYNNKQPVDADATKWY